MLVAFFFIYTWFPWKPKILHNQLTFITHGAVKFSTERARFQNLYSNRHIPNQSQWTGEKTV